MKDIWNLVPGVCAVACVLCLTSCGKKPSSGAKVPVIGRTNVFLEGQWHEVLTMTNGIGIDSVGSSDVVVYFREGLAVLIGFDPKTMTPLNITLKKPRSAGRPAETIVDSDADGIPEIKEVEGETKRQILFRGDWYPRETRGTNSIIIVGGKEVEVSFDGRRWAEVMTR